MSSTTVQTRVQCNENSTRSYENLSVSKLVKTAILNTAITIGSPKRRVECTNNASKCQFALSSPHSFVICRAPQALN